MRVGSREEVGKDKSCCRSRGWVGSQPDIVVIRIDVVKADADADDAQS